MRTAVLRGQGCADLLMHSRGDLGRKLADVFAALGANTFKVHTRLSIARQALLVAGHSLTRRGQGDTLSPRFTPHVAQVRLAQKRVIRMTSFKKAANLD